MPTSARFKEIRVLNYGNSRGDVGIAPYKYSRNTHSCNRPGLLRQKRQSRPFSVCSAPDYGFSRDSSSRYFSRYTFWTAAMMQVEISRFSSELVSGNISAVSVRSKVNRSKDSNSRTK